MILGRGTFGTVRLENGVAIKKFSDGEREFLWEAQCLSDIKSEYVVGLRGIRVETKEIAMEPMDGSLHQLLKKRDVEVGTIYQMMLQIAQAIRDINLCGYIHRDIKPGNILYKKDKDGEYIFKLCDFSSATAIDNISRSGYTTYPFSAPEAMISRNYNTKIDVWGLAMSVLYCFDGKLIGDKRLECLRVYFGNFGIPTNMIAAALKLFGQRFVADCGSPSEERTLSYVINTLLTGIENIEDLHEEFPKLLANMLDMSQKNRPSIGKVLKTPLFDGCVGVPISPLAPRVVNIYPVIADRHEYLELIGEMTHSPKILIHVFDIFDRARPAEGEETDYILSIYDLVLSYLHTAAKECKTLREQYSEEVETDARKLQPKILAGIKYRGYRTTYFEKNGGVLMDWETLKSLIMTPTRLYGKS